MIKPISTELTELFRAVRALTLSEKLRLIQFLANELTHPDCLATRANSPSGHAEPFPLDNERYFKALCILAAWDVTFTEGELNEMRANPGGLEEILQELEREDRSP